MRDADDKIISASKHLWDAGENRRTRIALRESQDRLAREVAGARTLQAISTRLISEVNQESLSAHIIDAAMVLMDADAAGLQMLAPDGKTLTLLAWRNFSPSAVAHWSEVTTDAGCTCAMALREKQRIVVGDVETCDFLEDTEDLVEYRRSGVRSFQVTPLYSRTGHQLGVISTHWCDPFTPSEDDFRLFDVLARQAADLIERTRVEGALRQNEVRQAFLLKLSDALRSLTDPVQIQETACQILGRHLGADWAQYGEIDVERWTFSLARDFFRSDQPSHAGLPSHVGEYDISLYPEHSRAWREGRSIAIADMENDPSLSEAERAGFLIYAVRASLTTPLMKNGQPVVIMSALSSTPRQWTDTDIALLEETADRTWAAIERGRAETALRQSETKYRSLFESMDEAFYLVEIVRDKDGKPEDVVYLDENAAGIRLAGTSVVGRRLGRLSPGSIPEWLPLFDQVARTGKPERFDKLSVATGKWQHYHLFPAGSGKDRLGILAKDITTRKLAEDKLRESETKYRSLFESMHEAFYLVEIIRDKDGRPVDLIYLDENAAGIRLVGRSVTGKRLSEVNPHAIAEWIPIFDRAIQTGLSEQFEKRSTLTGIWQHFQVFPAGSGKDRAGALTSDISGRKLAEDKLRESEARFRAIADSSPVIIWMSDTEGKVVYLNQPWLDFTGHTLEFALGEGWAEALHPEDIPPMMATYERAREGREMFQADFRVRRADGEYRSFVSTCAPRYHGDGSFAGYVGSSIDVTERRRAEEALATINQRLADAQEDERARIARELHDDVVQRLVALGWQLGAAGNALPAEGAARDIDSVRTQVMSLARDVQALSRRLHPIWVDFLGIAAAVKALCREVSRQSGIEIVCQVEDVAEGISQANAVSLHRVLQEALQNAVKHSRSPKIEVSLRVVQDEIEMTVTDFGTGFDPVARGHHGLGLTSMKERLRAIGGRLSIASQPGQTAIRATVPVSEGTDQPA